MSQNPRWKFLLWILGFALLDQGSKWLAKAYLTTDTSVPLIPGLFQLTLTFNTGAAFSLLKQHPQLLSIFTSLLFITLLCYALIRSHYAKGERLAMALILGGALGNLIDRLATGRVTDYFDVIAIRYPIFNVADSFIFVGVLLMMGVLLKNTPSPIPPAEAFRHHEPPTHS